MTTHIGITNATSNNINIQSKTLSDFRTTRDLLPNNTLPPHKESQNVPIPDLGIHLNQ